MKSLKRLIVALGIVIVCSNFGGIQARDNPIKEIVFLSGKQLKLFEIALSEFKKYKGKSYDDYKITLYHENRKGIFIFIFEDPDNPPSQRGSVSNLPNFEIEIRADDYEVISSGFYR